MDEKTVVGLNGFGRFSLNLLWWYLRDPDTQYRIAYINDETLTPEKIVDIIKHDELVTGFKGWKVALSGSTLILQEPSGRTEEIHLTHTPAEEIPWLGTPTIFFECSGSRSARAELCRPFLVGDTKIVVVSATCFDADTTLISGFNLDTFDPEKHKIVSYGSCTVNPGTTLSKFFDDTFGVKGLTVHVIHNVQKYHLDAGEYHTLQRKFCTLESMAPRLLSFFDEHNLIVRYTVVPWEGASIIDFTYRLSSDQVSREQVVAALQKATSHGGTLHGLIGMIDDDAAGPSVHIGSPYSAVIVESDIRVMGDTVHLFCYFYNEGSGIRMHEVANHIAQKISQ